MDVTHEPVAAPRVLLGRETLLRLWLIAHRLAVVGLVAIGVSGLLAWGLGSALGEAFVAGDTPGVTYTPERCADLAEYAPHATTCGEAAANHHFGEVVQYRVAAGVLGLLAAAAYLLVRRRATGSSAVVPDTLEDAVGAALFGAAGAGLLLLGLGQLSLGRDAGAGMYLSAGIVALPIGIVYGVRLYRTLLRRERAKAAPTA